MLEISVATPADASDVISLRQNARNWLLAKQTDQWQEPWPSAKGERERFLQSIENKETYIVRASAKPVATYAVDKVADPRLWTEFERTERALYVHRFVVHRDYGGLKLGATLMDLIAVEASHDDYQWLRVDVWTTNHGLHQYYQGLGFQYVRTVESDYPSGALFQRPVTVRSHPLPRRPCPGPA